MTPEELQQKQRVDNLETRFATNWGIFERWRAHVQPLVTWLIIGLDKRARRLEVEVRRSQIHAETLETRLKRSEDIISSFGTVIAELSARVSVLEGREVERTLAERKE